MEWVTGKLTDSTMERGMCFVFYMAWCTRALAGFYLALVKDGALRAPRVGLPRQLNVMDFALSGLNQLWWSGSFFFPATFVVFEVHVAQQGVCVAFVCG